MALAIFHFNVQYIAGDKASYHRYCENALIPVILAVRRNRLLRLSIEIAGSGLEFFAKSYELHFNLLVTLIRENRIELISSTYVPSVWPAFPGVDLLQSVQVNRECLARLGLMQSRVFFAQEAFFGPGLEVLANEFDAFVCSADYLEYLGHQNVEGAYKCFGKKLIVARNHILNGIHRADEGSGTLPSQLRARLSQTLAVSKSQPTGTTACGLQWQWLHCGSGHYWSVLGTPGAWDDFFYDETWERKNIHLWTSVLESGFELAFVQEFAEQVNGSSLTPVGQLFEGSWNTGRSRGIFAWMGAHRNRWENSPGLYASAWRARRMLREAEKRDTELGLGSTEVRDRLREVRRRFCFAQSSDGHGWLPTPGEVQFTFDSSDAVKREMLLFSGSYPTSEVSELTLRGVADSIAPSVVEIVGASGEISMHRSPSLGVIVQCAFSVVDKIAGVRFGRSCDEIMYCPSGLECVPQVVLIHALPQPEIFLPLANGLIQVSNCQYIIRINDCGVVAVRLVREEPWLYFCTEGSPVGRWYRWRFLVFTGELSQAVAAANFLNCI